MSDREWCNKNCPYEPDCYGWGYDVCNYVILLLKEQEERIGALTRTLEQMLKPTKLLDVFGDGYAKVVRCKDCLHADCFDSYVLCRKSSEKRQEPPDWFCADGERKEI